MPKKSNYKNLKGTVIAKDSDYLYVNPNGTKYKNKVLLSKELSNVEVNDKIDVDYRIEWGNAFAPGGNGKPLYLEVKKINSVTKPNVNTLLSYPFTITYTREFGQGDKVWHIKDRELGKVTQFALKKDNTSPEKLVSIPCTKELMDLKPNKAYDVYLYKVSDFNYTLDTSKEIKPAKISLDIKYTKYKHDSIDPFNSFEIEYPADFPRLVEKAPIAYHGEYEVYFQPCFSRNKNKYYNKRKYVLNCDDSFTKLNANAIKKHKLPEDYDDIRKERRELVYLREYMQFGIYPSVTISEKIKHDVVKNEVNDYWKSLNYNFQSTNLAGLHYVFEQMSLPTDNLPKEMMDVNGNPASQGSLLPFIVIDEKTSIFRIYFGEVLNIITEDGEQWYSPDHTANSLDIFDVHHIRADVVMLPESDERVKEARKNQNMYDGVVDKAIDSNLYNLMCESGQYLNMIPLKVGYTNYFRMV